MDPESASTLVTAFEEFDRDDEAAVAVLWGEGGSFCAGWDLKYGASLMKDPSPIHEIDFPLSENLKIPRGPLGPTRLELDKPVIAAVSGPAVAGGFELALWCDVRVMEESAYFGVYCRRWGVPLIDGGTVRLPRLIGQSRALDMILTGREVGPEEALAWGLANRLAPAGRALDEAKALALHLAKFPQTCMRSDRRSSYEQWGMDLREALVNEARLGLPALEAESQTGAARFVAGKGRGGSFGNI